MTTGPRNPNLAAPRRTPNTCERANFFLRAEEAARLTVPRYVPSAFPKAAPPPRWTIWARRAREFAGLCLCLVSSLMIVGLLSMVLQ